MTSAEGVLAGGTAEQAEGRTYLLVNDEPVTQRDFVDAIAAELGAPCPRGGFPTGRWRWAGRRRHGHAARMRQPPP